MRQYLTQFFTSWSTARPFVKGFAIFTYGVAVGLGLSHLRMALLYALSATILLLCVRYFDRGVAAGTIRL